MQEILTTKSEGYDFYRTTSFSPLDMSRGLSRLTNALRQTLPLLERQTNSDDHGDVTLEWLFQVLDGVPSELSSGQLVREILDASRLEDEGTQQEALFTALGASEESIAVLFQLVPRLREIGENISYDELFDRDQLQELDNRSDMLDDPNLELEKLRREAIDAAQVAAIARSEAESFVGPRGIGSTHSIQRLSDISAQKLARKAAKRANQALQRAKAAGAIIDESDLLAVSTSMLGDGGLLGHSQDRLQALQSNLLPEGTRIKATAKGLPAGTVREENDEIGYEKVTIPPKILDAAELLPLLKIADILDFDSAIAFDGVDSLNPMQSTVFDTAFNRRENMLVCAPTGAGKTNVAMLTLTAHFRDVGLIGQGGRHGLDVGEKVVYIAPMKALAQEVVAKYSEKLKPLGLIVRELTGDMQLSRAEAQSANLLVTTPEKWDVVTRKSGNDDNSLGNQCGLLIIDEVHLLADERGAVIESLVSRLHRLVESRQKQLRIVGLSATLPNYHDVAEFLQVPAKGLFFFGPEHRPVPLQQQFVGVYGNVKKRHEIEEKMDDVCYETVKESLARGYQVMVFVHSRKGTSDAASALARRATAASELDRYFLSQGKEGRAGDAYKRFVDRVRKSRSRELSNHFYNGMGIHHAGMLRGDRRLSESMFAAGAIKVLCTTATLAWGVNLPAHSVIIKGTDVYNPEKGKNVDLSILDVQQIFGRAGRPQFDSSGEATLITNHAAMTRYLDKLVRAVPIESTFVKHLADHLNAEIVGGTVTNVNEAAKWLSYTYLYVRMLKNPLAYGIAADEKSDDPMLRSRCLELVKQAASYLSSIEIVSYDSVSGNLSMTTVGRVAAHFYIQAETIANFNEIMMRRHTPSDADLLRMVSSAREFENIRFRQDEQTELDSLKHKCPLELQGPVVDSGTKTFVLIQAYISRERPKSFTLISDTNYIASNAGRIARAMFEMCLSKDRAGAALKLLRLAKSIDNQFWWFQTPLRHFEDDIGVRILKAVESRQSGTAVGRYDSFASTLALLEMTSDEVGQICRAKKAVGERVKGFVGMIPRPAVTCNILPVTSDVLRFQIAVLPEFEWRTRWHGTALPFWLWIEDSESGRIYHQEQVTFTILSYPDSIKLDLPIPSFSHHGTQYLVRVVSTSWVGVEMVHPVSLAKIHVPTHISTQTELLDLTPLPVAVLEDENYERLFSKIETFNPVQTQAFHVLYHTDVPIFIGAPTGSGKTVLAELAILRMKRIHKNGICVYIAPLKSLARERLLEWKRKLGDLLNWNVLELTGDTQHDRRVIERADILVCTPEKWDLISRGWRGNTSRMQGHKHSFVTRVRLLVIDEIHLLGEERGAVLEAIVSRTRFISRHLKEENGDIYSSVDAVRIVGLSTAIANPLDVAAWIGINTDIQGSTYLQGLYNFRPSIRPVPTIVHVQGYPGKHYCPRMATMNKPCYAVIKQHSPGRPALIFVASRRQTRLTALDLISYGAADENPRGFLQCDESYVEAVITDVQDEALKHTLAFGIGLHHAGLSVNDRDIVERMFLNGEIQVLVATATLAWGVNLPARLVIVKGTEYFDGKTSRYVDYPLTDVLQMIGRAGRPGFDTEGRAVVLVESSKKNYYKKFLYTPFPVESCLKGRLDDNINAEIAAGTIISLIDCVGYLKWTFFARRVKANPTYYGASSSKVEDVEDYLLCIAKESIVKLKLEECVVVEDEEGIDYAIRPTVLGSAACDFYLAYSSPKQMLFGLTKCARLLQQKFSLNSDNISSFAPGTVPTMDRPRSLDEVAIASLLFTLCSTHEFDELPVRHNEASLNERLSNRLSWGPNIDSLLSSNQRTSPPDTTIYSDPHTKCFLLVQAHIERARLPISDYINDSKTVMDSVPRLLAAMQFIGSEQRQKEGLYEVLCQLVKARQVLGSRLKVQDDPIVQIKGISAGTASLFQRSFEDVRSSKSNSLQRLCFMAPDAIEETLRRVPEEGAGRLSIESILDALSNVPRFVVRDACVVHEVNKANGRSKGFLRMKIEFDGGGSTASTREKAPTCSIGIVVGTFESQILLGYSEISTTAGASKRKRVVQKEIEFDWGIANSYGGSEGGWIVVGMLPTYIRGMDIEMRVSLS